MAPPASGRGVHNEPGSEPANWFPGGCSPEGITGDSGQLMDRGFKSAMGPNDFLEGLWTVKCADGPDLKSRLRNV